MSGLDKWNRRESFLCRLRDFLTNERPPANRNSLNSTNSSSDSFSLDLDQSFQKVLNTHLNKKEKQSMEDKENLFKTAAENTVRNSLIRKLDDQRKSINPETLHYNFNDSTMIGENDVDSDDDCFEDLERMCNKTFSDPENTIHEYLARRRSKWSKSNCSSLANATNEDACLARLLNEVEKQLEEGRKTFGGQIELNDIQEPSGMWDSTVAGDLSTIQLTPESPLRNKLQSPNVMEKNLCLDVSVDLSAHKISNEYKSKVANETYTLGPQNMTHGKISTFQDNTFEQDLSGSEIMPITTKAGATEQQICDEMDLINLAGEESSSDPKNIFNGTFYQTPMKNSSKERVNPDCDLIDLNAPFSAEIKQERGYDPAHLSTHIDDTTIIVLSDDEDVVSEYSESHNTAFSVDMDETQGNISGLETLDEHRHFNNTLEEVDFILKQGMRYMAESGNLPKCLQTKDILSPSPMSSPQTPNTVMKKPLKLATLEKPKPMETFKRPNVFSKIPQSRTVPMGLKKPSGFRHIVSPVGAYIKNTPKVPMTADMKPTAKAFQSKAAKELNYSMQASGVLKADQPNKEPICTLPKKAYISSDVRKVVDQRKPCTIPGGDKIHKYLQHTKVPAVIRHEGKIKSSLPMFSRQNISQREDSLADLSIMSGDVSVHILKDAKR